MSNERQATGTIKDDCPYCGDGDKGRGFIFDSLVACTRCAVGKAIQHGYDVAELARVELRAKHLRWKIGDYQVAQLKAAAGQ